MRVFDKTGEKVGSEDVWGFIREIDGSNALIEYDSGNRRWKALWNLVIEPKKAEE